MSPTAEDDRLLRAVVEAHNSIRGDQKLGPLRRNDVLDRAAMKHAADMAERKVMSHDGADGSTAAQRVERVGFRYRSTGENVARGQTTATSVMSAWMNSPPHKENILGDYDEIGVGLVRADDGQPFWCVEFGKPWPKLDTANAPTQFVDAVNARRKQAGKKPLRVNPKLSAVAQEEASMLARAGKLDAGDDRGEAVAKQVRASGYAFRTLAQLAAGGQPTAGELATYLLKSDENRAMLLGDYSDVGIGVAPSAKSMPYWTIILARSVREPR